MRSRQSGFTLIEIMVVMAIIVTLAGMVVLSVKIATDNNKKTGCANNLRQMGTILVANHAQKPWPRKSGAGFLLSLYFSNKQVRGDLKVYICPGDEQGVEDPGGEEHKEMFAALDSKLETYDDYISSYAGRRIRTYPLRSDVDENQSLACDRNGVNGDIPHHGDGVNVLFEDGKVEFWDHQKLGLSPDEMIPIGPGGPAVLEPLGFLPD